MVSRIRCDVLGLLAIAAVLVFLFLTANVRFEWLLPFDNGFLLWLREKTALDTNNGFSALRHTVDDFTALGGVTLVVLFTSLTVVFLLIQRQLHNALYLMTTMIGGWLLSSTLKVLIARPRPDIVEHLVHVNDLSFPSGHSMLSAVLYGTLAIIAVQYLRSEAAKNYVVIVATMVVLLVGLSRIILGVHFPTDVIAGWCLGFAWVVICHWAFIGRLERTAIQSET